MANELDLRAISSDIKFNLVTDRSIEDQLSRIYKVAYERGRSDQKKLMNRQKMYYSFLYEWIFDQLSQLYLYTKRYEYKEILNGLETQADQYLYEYKLSSSRKMRNFTCMVNSQEEHIKSKEEICYLLTPVVEDFIRREDEKQRRERERKALENQNKQNE